MVPLTIQARAPTIESVCLVIHAADFWEMGLKCRFRIDYHKAASLTRDFDFVEALLKPIDDGTDTQIVIQCAP